MAVASLMGKTSPTWWCRRCVTDGRLTKTTKMVTLALHDFKLIDCDEGLNRVHLFVHNDWVFVCNTHVPTNTRVVCLKEDKEDSHWILLGPRNPPTQCHFDCHYRTPHPFSLCRCSMAGFQKQGFRMLHLPRPLFFQECISTKGPGRCHFVSFTGKNRVFNCTRESTKIISTNNVACTPFFSCASLLVIVLSSLGSSTSN